MLNHSTIKEKKSEGKGPSILVLEDNSINQHLIAAALKKTRYLNSQNENCNADFCIATTTEEAFQYIDQLKEQSKVFDFMYIDFNLSEKDSRQGKNGYTFASNVRQLGYKGKVVLYSAETNLNNPTENAKKMKEYQLTGISVFDGLHDKSNINKTNMANIFNKYKPNGYTASALAKTKTKKRKNGNEMKAGENITPGTSLFPTKLFRILSSENVVKDPPPAPLQRSSSASAVQDLATPICDTPTPSSLSSGGPSPGTSIFSRTPTFLSLPPLSEGEEVSSPTFSSPTSSSTPMSRTSNSPGKSSSDSSQSPLSLDSKTRTTPSPLSPLSPSTLIDKIHLNNSPATIKKETFPAGTQITIGSVSQSTLFGTRNAEKTKTGPSVNKTYQPRR